MILITGASGLVGEALYNYLVKYLDVIGTSYTTTDERFTALDLTDDSQVRSLFQGRHIDAVLHCASSIPSRAQGSKEILLYEENMRMAINILKNINNNTFFINISSTAIYDLEGSFTLNENSAIKNNTLYQLSKRHTEEMLYLFYGRTTNLLNIRISSPYSISKDSDTILYRFIKTALNKKRIQLWGSGERVQFFTNVHNLASAVRELYDNRINGNLNYVTTASVSMSELAKRIQRQIPGLVIEKTDIQDPEENCRTSIDISKVLQYINIEDTLDEDIKAIIKRLS